MSWWLPYAAVGIHDFVIGLPRHVLHKYTTRSQQHCVWERHATARVTAPRKPWMSNPRLQLRPFFAQPPSPTLSPRVARRPPKKSSTHRRAQAAPSPTRREHKKGTREPDICHLPHSIAPLKDSWLTPVSPDPHQRRLPLLGQRAGEALVHERRRQRRGEEHLPRLSPASHMA